MEKQSIIVLCLGDSLTAGFIQNNLHTPYSEHLAEIFKSQGREDIFLVNEGVDGDTLEDILDRLPTLLRQHQYHHVVLLGGTNDLGQILTEDNTTVTPEEATAHIAFEPIYGLLMTEDSIKSVLHLTVPYNSFDRLDVHEKNNKDALNRRIIENHCPKKRVLDLNDPRLQFNHLLMTDDERDKNWQDGLHYSAHGYKRLADCIHAELLKIIIS
ncbi:hypothetical protein BGX27_001845 [Mortierella sp. AM989]|nr:hypothetical protein BGX27_001845 [Mortierella sp. AM989]